MTQPALYHEQRNRPSRVGSPRGVCSTYTLGRGDQDQPRRALGPLGSRKPDRAGLFLTDACLGTGGFAAMAARPNQILVGVSCGFQPALRRPSIHAQQAHVRQDSANAPHSHSSNPFLNRRLDSLDANERGFARAERPFAFGAKGND